MAIKVPTRSFTKIKLWIVINLHHSAKSEKLFSFHRDWKKQEITLTGEQSAGHTLKIDLILGGWEPHYLNKQRLMPVFELVSRTPSKVKTMQTFLGHDSPDRVQAMTGSASKKGTFLPKCGTHSLIYTSGTTRLQMSKAGWVKFHLHCKVIRFRIFFIFFCFPKRTGCHGANTNLKDPSNF